MQARAAGHPRHPPRVISSQPPGAAIGGADHLKMAMKRKGTRKGGRPTRVAHATAVCQSYSHTACQMSDSHVISALKESGK
jgi:hypothetical protein